MKSIQVNKKYYEKLIEASNEWKAGTPREKFLAVVLSLVSIQRESNSYCRKLAYGKQAVCMSDRQLRAIYKDATSRTKFRRIVKECELAIIDKSWISKELADRNNQSPRSNNWHFTEADYSGEKIKVEYSTNYGIFGIYKRQILKAEDSPVNDTDIFKGVWAIDDYEAGQLSFSDFYEVGKVAHNLLQGKVKTEVSARDYDAVSLCKKSLRSRCFVNKVTGQGMKEVYDISASSTFTAPLAASALGFTQFDNTDIFAWGNKQVEGTEEKYDRYTMFYSGVRELDKRDFYLDNRTFSADSRKKVKTDTVIVLNSSADYITQKHFIYDGKKKVKKSQYLQAMRQWLIWKSIRLKDNKLWEVAFRCKASGIPDAFYRVHTLGEKMVMDYLIKELNKQGYSVHRVHDALWSTDSRLVNLSERDMKKKVGKIFVELFDSCKNRKDDKAVAKKLASSISDNLKNWAKEALIVPSAVEKQLAKIRKAA